MHDFALLLQYDVSVCGATSQAFNQCATRRVQESTSFELHILTTRSDLEPTVHPTPARTVPQPEPVVVRPFHLTIPTTMRSKAGWTVHMIIACARTIAGLGQREFNGEAVRERDRRGRGRRRGLRMHSWRDDSRYKTKTHLPNATLADDSPQERRLPHEHADGERGEQCVACEWRAMGPARPGTQAGAGAIRVVKVCSAGVDDQLSECSGTREDTSQYADLGPHTRSGGVSFESTGGSACCFTGLDRGWGREGIPYDDAQHLDTFAAIHDLSEPSGGNLGKMKNRECGRE